MSTANPRLTTAKDRYLRYMEVERRRAASSIRGPRREIGKLINSLPPEVERTRDLQADHVSDFVEKTYSNIADKTFNLYIGHVKRWLKWCAEEGYFDAGQTPWRRLERREKPLPVRKKSFIREERVMELAAAGGEYHPRDKYYILCSYFMSRRMSEMRVLQWEDIDFTPRPSMPLGTFTFRNVKSRRSRTMPLYPELREVLEEWQAIYEKLTGRKPRKADYVFPVLRNGPARTRGGTRQPMVMVPDRPMWEDGGGDIMDRARRATGIWVEGEAHHGLRRGGASDLFDKLGDIRLAQTLLDHSTVVTTEEYLERQQSIRDLAKALNPEDDPEKKALPADTPEQAGVIRVDFRSRRQLA